VAQHLANFIIKLGHTAIVQINDLIEIERIAFIRRPTQACSNRYATAADKPC
jgi:hypothetical protein